MKIDQIVISGFRGFSDRVAIQLAPGFTVIDGRNGVGKSTIFDAVEFSLTGQMSKYNDMKAGGESVDDYIWWKGDGPAPSERFVEVTFTDDAGSVTLRRTPIEEPSPSDLERVKAGMVDLTIAPPNPLSQLCAASIIRDENIASLSLDLSETQRYAKLRQAIGAIDADAWAERGATLVQLAKKRSDQSKAEVAAANSAVADASRRIDEARASLAPEAAVGAASATLTQLLQAGQIAPDQLVSPGRQFVAQREREAADLADLLEGWPQYDVDRRALSESQSAIDAQEAKLEQAKQSRTALPAPAEAHLSGANAELIARLHELRRLGSEIGVLDHSCPLCAASHDTNSFAAGLAKAGELIDRLDREASAAAAEATSRRAAIAAADKEITGAAAGLASLKASVQKQGERIEARRRKLENFGFAADAGRDDVARLHERLMFEADQAGQAVRVLATLSQNRQIETGNAQLADARSRLARAQERAGRARRSEAIASALHDAARRAGSETLDLRLERVLPLMAELYGRLRPHPIWQDIEYSIRGDLRRFLSLQVGDGLNPQFLFSSGQRRATGLAFLLSINLSLAWSRWRTILLDDPVQHVDDFRTVNLAEVLAQLVADGRQVIVAVEDAALAELLARRMPVSSHGQAARLTLGLGSTGCPAIVSETHPSPMVQRVLAA